MGFSRKKSASDKTAPEETAVEEIEDNPDLLRDDLSELGVGKKKSKKDKKSEKKDKKKEKREASRSPSPKAFAGRSASNQSVGDSKDDRKKQRQTKKDDLKDREKQDLDSKKQLDSSLGGSKSFKDLKAPAAPEFPSDAESMSQSGTEGSYSRPNSSRRNSSKGSKLSAVGPMGEKLSKMPSPERMKDSRGVGSVAKSTTTKTGRSGSPKEEPNGLSPQRKVPTLPTKRK